MKLDKKVFKQIVKECLIEILSEGLGSNSQESSSFGQSNSSISNTLMSSNKKVDENFTRRRAPSAPIDSPLSNAVRELTQQHPSMASIFEDTAKTTLAAQHVAERSGQGSALISAQGDHAARIVDAASPEQIFGEEVTSKWANLAFTGTANKS